MGRDRARTGRADADGGLAEAADALDQLAVWWRRLVPTEVSQSAIVTLHTLRRDGPLRVSELASREALTQPGTTLLVNRLEAAGHAERIPDPTDGRASLVRITPLGRKVLADRHAARVAILVDQVRHLSDADRAAFLAALPALDRLTSQKVSV